MATEWRNRIVGHGDVPPGELLANPANWRLHPPHQQKAMAASLGELGWLQQVIVNRTTGLMVDGHLRVELAREQGAAAVPVVYGELRAEDSGLSDLLSTLDVSLTEFPEYTEAAADAVVYNECPSCGHRWPR